MNTLVESTVSNAATAGQALLGSTMDRRQASKVLLRSVFSLAALATALRAGSGFAKKVDNPTTPPPVDTGTVANGKIQRRLRAVVELEGGSPRWVLKGSGFSSDRIDLNVFETKSGEPLWLLGEFEVIYGPSFSFRTNINPDKGLPVGHAYDITAWDNGTNLPSNTVQITTS